MEIGNITGTVSWFYSSWLEGKYQSVPNWVANTPVQNLQSYWSKELNDMVWGKHGSWKERG